MARTNNNGLGPLSQPLSVECQPPTDFSLSKSVFAQQYSHPSTQNSEGSFRVMSGKCTFIERDPRRPLMVSQCTCPAGQYDTPASTDTLCTVCTHRLDYHENAQSNKELHSILGKAPFWVGHGDPKLTSNHQDYRSYTLVNNPTTCPREETVSALWKRIQQYHVIHVRATPASGKSTLSRLLQSYVQRHNPEIPVLWCS